MIPQSQAKIFLSKNRSITNSGRVKSCATFKEVSNSSSALSVLYNLKDDVLSARKTLTIVVEDDADLILLPIAGTVIYKDSCGNNAIIEAGEIQYFRVKRSDVIKIFNPYDDAFINFIHLWMKPGSLNSFSTKSCFSFEEDNKNKLIKLFDDDNENTAVKVSVGKFYGRRDVLYKIKQFGSCLFVFVIEGAFEVQYRLLGTRDALALWNIEEAEVEALSNNAVLLIVEFPCAC